jgi:hypothetical protein
MEPQRWIHCEATVRGGVYWFSDYPQDHATLETIPPPDALWAVEFLEEMMPFFDYDPVPEIVQRAAAEIWGPGA